MRTKLTRAAVLGISDPRDAEIAERLCSALTQHAPDEVPGTAPKHVVNMRDNVRDGRNGAVRTLLTLARASGAAREIAAILLELAPDRDLPDSCVALELEETRVQGKLNSLKCEDLAGTITTPERAEYVDTIYEEIRLDTALVRAEESALYGSLRRSA